MTRMFACFILGLTMVLGSNLRADDKSSAPKAPAEKKDAPGKPKKRETVFGTVKHFDAEKGVVTLELQRRKNAPGGEKEFKLPKGITVTVFENGKLKDVERKDAWKQIKEGSRLTINLKEGEIVGVIVASPRKK